MQNLLTRSKEWMIHRWNSRFFRKSFLLILFITSIPGIISGIGIYLFGLHSTETELRKMHVEELDERAENINEQFNYLEESLSYWAFEPTFNTKLINMDYVRQFQKTRDLKQKMIILQGSHPLIEHVELFVDGEDPVVFSPYLYYLRNQEEYQSYSSLLDGPQNVTWEQPEEFREGTNFKNNIVLSHQIPGVSNNPFGAIVVTIDQNSLAQLLETLTPYSDGLTVLLNQSNEVMLSTPAENQSELMTRITNHLAGSETEDQSFQIDVDDVTYSVSYGEFDRIGSTWTYVSAAPISAITSPIVTISKVILIASLSLLFVAFGMTWFASNRLYQPVRRLALSFGANDRNELNASDEFEQISKHFRDLTDERKRLEKRLTAQLPQLRQNFLVQLTKGFLFDYSEGSLQKRMESYRWKVEDHSFILLDLQLTGMYDSKSNKEDDDSLVTFAMANMADDITPKYFNQYTILNYYDLSAGVFLVVPNQLTDEKLQINQLAEELSEAVSNVLQLSVTITVSSKVEKIKQINLLFEEIGRGKRYREFENQNQIIHLNELNEDNNMQKLIYPFELEKEIIQCVRRGRTNEAESSIRHFFNQLIQNGAKEGNVQASTLQLYSSIQHEILHSGIDPTELFNGRNMFEELAQIREREWIVRWLVDQVIKPYVDIIESNVNMEMKRLVDEIVAYIHEHYMEDISLESCADKIGTTAYSLSKAFKRILGTNFIDYLTEVRMDHAKELLLQTNWKISDIAESVGYRHSYFNRIFKKQVGLPPSQFRKMNANSS
ncbi:AraC family transcriptional regulator [Gracilibacillus sp. YIM 98692]|uniref:helix-turn-helix domain-containing protein n=1 Tax=Gracilibacillus sp. YIM 98692 TaxID=2663532 RepID=UPI0013D0A22D|nr:AraC family transcriptional regulator [Gracilibacillus sp. YIM 98692]